MAASLLATLVGGPTARGLASLEIDTPDALLRHYPRRYDQLGRAQSIATLPLGERTTVLGTIRESTARRMRTRKGELLTVLIADREGTTLRLTFFNGSRLKHVLKPGCTALFSGEVTIYKRERELTHPRFQILGQDLDLDELARTDGAPIAIYPASAQIDSWSIAKAVATLLDTLGDVPDPLPAGLRDRHGLIGLREALEMIHRPGTTAEHRTARRRLVYEEAFVLQAALGQRRLVEGAQPARGRRPAADGLLATFDARLPFALTPGQEQVGQEIAADLARDHPMHRLLHGEVGSGKTVVALRAMLTVIDSGGQAALLAPTEVLAAQHHRSITAMLGDLAAGGMLGGSEIGTRVVLLTGSLPTAARRAALLDAASGDAGIVVGTHALLADRVEFFDLGLAVVDEQHRFGVEQRDALRGKGRDIPHLLVMTATPIPRTVAMTVFGDLETSTLRGLPPGRPPIASHVVDVAERPAWLERAWQRVAEEVAAGHQAYVVCSRIGSEDPEPPEGESALPPTAAVLDTLDRLRAHPSLAGLRIEMLHGRMPADERDAVMQAFAAGDVGVLVATTVIEVGVDVPNATVMVVLDADRFGVSQLHQLRGRVGRGTGRGLCLLVTAAPSGSGARERVDAVAETTDGFELARIDLEQRREGDVLGTAQSGRRSSLRLLRVLRDEEVIVSARHEATQIVAEDPDLTGHPALAAAIQDLLGDERQAFLDRG